MAVVTGEHLPPPPPPDGDRERAWIVEGLRRALARAPVDELTHLVDVLAGESGGEASVAGWMMMLVADEVGRQELLLRDLDDKPPGD